MNNIQPLINIVNTLPIPLMLSAYKTFNANTRWIRIYFNCYDFIEVSSDKEKWTIPESFYPSLINFDIKINDLTAMVVEIQKYLYTMATTELDFFRPFVLAKDINNVWYLPQDCLTREEMRQYHINVALFFNQEETAWNLLNI